MKIATPLATSVSSMISNPTKHKPTFQSARLHPRQIAPRHHAGGSAPAERASRFFHRRRRTAHDTEYPAANPITMSSSTVPAPSQYVYAVACRQSSPPNHVCVSKHEHSPSFVTGVQ